MHGSDSVASGVIFSRVHACRPTMTHVNKRCAYMRKRKTLQAIVHVALLLYMHASAKPGYSCAQYEA